MINDLKDLKSLLKLCRSQGVTEIKLDTVEFKLGDMPTGPKSSSVQDQTETDDEDPFANFPTGILTPEQAAFYSAGGTPEDDPFRAEQ
jgi:CO dehydrogenase/acetyl-CoA synthase gamma subunit (corrinoid Fe-S protein)